MTRSLWYLLGFSLTFHATVVAGRSAFGKTLVVCALWPVVWVIAVLEYAWANGRRGR